jgi:hypothetical protein
MEPTKSSETSSSEYLTHKPRGKSKNQEISVRSQVLIMLTTTITGDLRQIMVGSYHRFGETCCLRHVPWRYRHDVTQKI